MMLTTEKYEASRGLFATAELLVSEFWQWDRYPRSAEGISSLYSSKYSYSMFLTVLLRFTNDSDRIPEVFVACGIHNLTDVIY